MQYISIFYNGQRLHLYLGYMSPNNYEKQLFERKKAA
ncbi:MAG: IS3 family transposase [Candidatus Thiodiazotropha sp. (ex Lucinoma aequizonata)]|nr:IS3 family transposase [Candidatus Thiodiazotropha sp. (ex Lucinoma aequizonata)]MCU7888739.1 IS3 family transposase [Candidatus Thiodiazotropha sp. (ex Lucinoma aequizonata)]MCU7894648.1 IS3 family transposase [Candidatus Thiodiazotropha sp. (ex Lucinoma aequizonata)]MCU7900144.1 IS3 family transposase [Candidatus Thiodiazotropha sp. (ex Lucinoma aequizonata)]MCU7903223.1 IS3 family transposase [Candidatus Thiodiazotropha sp. (ex Lucinoma aequizonata)]